MTIERDDITEIVNAVASAGIEEFSLEVGNLKVRLRRAGAAPAMPGAGTTAPLVEGAGSDAAAAPEPASPDAAPPTHGLISVTAPLIGTFYRAPAPDAAPFVEVGSHVEPDDIVCIVEVMKLMNAVRAGCRGCVVEICAGNGALVEYGQTLMRIAPEP